MDAATAVQELRAEASLSTRDLARRSGVALSTISRTERGHMSPTLDLLTRIGAAVDRAVELDVGVVEPVDRSLALHIAIAARLLEDPQGILAKARRNLTTMRNANADGSADNYFDEWETILEWSPDRIAAGLVSPHQRWDDLRNVTPFAGVLTDDKRRRILEAVGRR